ncbi:enoyl-CoA hydratase/isomerase family protein [Desulfoscipio gibsoniae]|uniref:short-chain-enoyl-CoA hydratase n=1 Tax=Desulfoscipio gibsoniae DSM 7213 TaxID=767817 RepID=R4KEG6_9FIRM|nr:enoyl-CoA hydratase [Desulfoscipio gibsoniae]AGL00047.1 enoyl-CoA hydratase/carnithine racemase [Desulfoscipio gibsoniae DSM 7213]
MDFKTIQLEIVDSVGVIYLNQPESRNALSLEMREELRVAMEGWAREAGVKVIIITGKGAAFCAGGDIRTMGNFKPTQGRERMKNVHRFVMTLRNLEKPIIAAVNGPAFGAGWSLALLCDLIVASEKARFSLAFVKVGLVPDWGSIYLLPRMIGLLKAKELMMTGRAIDAAEAYNLGLVNKVVPPEQLFTSAMELARELAQGPPLALGMLKNLVNRSPEVGFLTLLEEEALVQDICLQTEDHREGVRAFFEKRKPRFTGTL